MREIMNLWSAAFLQMSALEWCPYLDLHLLRQEFLHQYALEAIQYHLVSWSDEFFDDDFGTSQQ